MTASAPHHDTQVGEGTDPPPDLIAHDTGAGDTGADAHGRTVLDGADISRALTRISHEIIERNKGAEHLLVLGIPSRGVPLAHRIAARISEVEGAEVEVGSIDVTMYRDDLRMHPARALLHTEIPAEGVDGKVVVLVDDVLYSGRTIRAALDALHDLGRPRAVRLAVLVDRGHRELPIRADFVGKNLPTSYGERVHVRLAETDGTDAVSIEDSEPGEADQVGRSAPGSGPDEATEERP